MNEETELSKCCKAEMYQSGACVWCGADGRACGNPIQILIESQVMKWSQEIDRVAQDFFTYPKWIAKSRIALKIYCKAKGYEIRNIRFGFVEFWIKNKKVAEVKLSKYI